MFALGLHGKTIGEIGALPQPKFQPLHRYPKPCKQPDGATAHDDGPDRKDAPDVRSACPTAVALLPAT